MSQLNKYKPTGRFSYGWRKFVKPIEMCELVLMDEDDNEMIGISYDSRHKIKRQFSHELCYDGKRIPLPDEFWEFENCNYNGFLDNGKTDCDIKTCWKEKKSGAFYWEEKRKNLIDLINDFGKDERLDFQGDCLRIVNLYMPKAAPTFDIYFNGIKTITDASESDLEFIQNYIFSVCCSKIKYWGEDDDE